jgi:hypothetical protein
VPDAASQALLELNQQLDRLRFDRLRLANESLTPIEEAIQLWSKFCAADTSGDLKALKRVGEDYLALQPLRVRGALFPGFDGIKAATVCFARALQWGAAADATSRWIEAVPADPRAHRYLVEARLKQSDVAGASAAFENYVKLRPEPDNDWHSTLTLALSLDNKALRENALGLETVASAATWRPLGERLTDWLWPRFESLSPGAKRKWWVALFALASPETADGIGDDRWAQAATNIGAAVEFELKARIFAPFARATRDLSDLDERWTHVMGGRGTLGELITCLCESQDASEEAPKRLARWLARQPKLLNYLRTSRKKLDDLVTLRNRAQHGDASGTPDSIPIGEEDVRRLYKHATALLDAIVVDDDGVARA